MHIKKKTCKYLIKKFFSEKKLKKVALLHIVLICIAPVLLRSFKMLTCINLGGNIGTVHFYETS